MSVRKPLKRRGVKLKGRATQKTLSQSGLVRKKAHASARTKKRQGRRDSK